jgi:hypothetical protein
MAALVAATALGGARTASARDLYIDPEHGADHRDGSSPSAAWRHAPGDVAARSRAARHLYDAGDRLLFRGGTVYRGRIHFPSAGTAEQPIQMVGNAWPAEGGTRARLDPKARPGQAAVTAQFRAHVMVVGFELAPTAMASPLAFSFAPAGHVDARDIVDASGRQMAPNLAYLHAPPRLMLAGVHHYRPFVRDGLMMAELMLIHPHAANVRAGFD